MRPVGQPDRSRDERLDNQRPVGAQRLGGLREERGLLRAASGHSRADLFTAAAEVAYLAGWMAADDLQPGLAQRHYIQSVRLATEAGDPLMRATALRSLAAQAVELGHCAPGLALADAAAATLHDSAPVRARAWVTGMEAEALAGTGHDPRRAVRLLTVTEMDLDRADSGTVEDWSGNYPRAAYEDQVGLTLRAMGDLPGAEEHFAASVQARRPNERRTRALIGTRLAAVQLRRRMPDAAASTILGLSDDLLVVKSARLRRSLGQISRQWQADRSDPRVAKADRLLLSAQAGPAGLPV